LFTVILNTLVSQVIRITHNQNHTDVITVPSHMVSVTVRRDKFSATTRKVFSEKLLSCRSCGRL